MCGRYTIIAKAEVIEKRFDVEVPEIYSPRYNAAPTQILPVITNEQPNGLSFFRWGLIPSWSKDTTIGAKMINARAETITEKASFKHAFKSRRCLVISDGYYEWKKLSSKSKIPYRIHLKSNQLFAFAGLWEQYINEDNTSIHTFTIITTESCKSTTQLHHRMPVILTPENEKIWLNESSTIAENLDLLQPYNDQDISFYTVSSLVNNVQNDNEQLILPAPSMDQSGNLTLFS